MNIKKLLLLGLISLMLFACNDEVNEENNSKETKEEAYFGLKLSFPTISDLRAGEPTTGNEDGDGFQVGLTTEQTFQNVMVILTDSQTDVINSIFNFTANDFVPDGNSANDNENITTIMDTRMYSMREAAKVEKGDARVFVFLNPTSEIASRFTVGSVINLALLEMQPIASSDLTSTIAMDDNFLMANTDMPEVITIDGTANNPTVFSVNVERTAAKLIENTATETFLVTNTSNQNQTTVTATLVNYNYNNLNKRTYFIKQTQQRNDAGAIAGTYIVDPNFTESSYLANSPAAPFYGNDFFTMGYRNINRAFSTSPEVTYLLENTMISNEQYLHKTTSVVYQAEISVNGAAPATFYTYKGLIYTNYADLEAVYNADYPNEANALANLFTEDEMENIYATNSDLEFSQLVNEFNTRLYNQRIKAYYNGICFYNWAIRHWDQPNVLLGRMEFGIVRNNVYYLEVANILNLGEPWLPGGSEDPEPEKPDEDENTYLVVNINVLPWTVRYNNMEF